MMIGEELQGFEVIPDGYEWGTLLPLSHLAMFNWDTDLTSKKLTVEDDQLTIKVKEGSGFKTSIGD